MHLLFRSRDFKRWSQWCHRPLEKGVQVAHAVACLPGSRHAWKRNRTTDIDGTLERGKSLSFPSRNSKRFPFHFARSKERERDVFTYDEGVPRERRRRKKRRECWLIVPPKYAFRRDERYEYSHTCARFRWKNVGGGGMLLHVGAWKIPSTILVLPQARSKEISSSFA